MREGITETDLAKKVIVWLEEQHWDVYQEVKFLHGDEGVADIAAVQNGRLWIIECKTTLSMSVLEQAYKWRSHFRSIAIPYSGAKGRDLAHKIAKEYLKVGVITVGKFQKINYQEFQSVHQRIPPPLMREYHKFAKRMIAELRPEHKTYLAAGSTGGGYYTPYRQTMDEVQRYIRYNPGCTLKEIVTNLSRHHYANDKSALGGIRVALSTFEKWCEVRADDNGNPRYYEAQP